MIIQTPDFIIWNLFQTSDDDDSFNSDPRQSKVKTYLLSCRWAHGLQFWPPVLQPSCSMSHWQELLAILCHPWEKRSVSVATKAVRICLPCYGIKVGTSDCRRRRTEPDGALLRVSSQGPCSVPVAPFPSQEGFKGNGGSHLPLSPMGWHRPVPEHCWGRGWGSPNELLLWTLKCLPHSNNQGQRRSPTYQWPALRSCQRYIHGDSKNASHSETGHQSGGDHIWGQ